MSRLTLAALVTGATVALAVVVGGPDAGNAVDGLASGGLTPSGAVAVVGLLCWTVLVAIGVGVSIGAVRAARTGPSPFAVRWWRLALVTVGLSLLVVGIIHRQAGYRVCCADSATAHQAEQRVR